MKRSLLCLVVTLCVISVVHADQSIRSLQQTLKAQGLYYGTVTGEKSAETTAAIRRYQIRNGLQITGELNDETLHSVNSSSNSVAGTTRTNSKPSVSQANSGHSDVSLPQSSAPSFSQPDRAIQIDPSYSASFYQSPPVRVNRRGIAEAQYQLMSRGYYRGRVDGKYGRQTAVAVRAFQLKAGLLPTGRLNVETLQALGSPDAEFAYLAPAPRGYETWMPVKKFKHGKWKMKWKRDLRSFAGEDSGEDRQTTGDPGRDPYNQN